MGETWERLMAWIWYLEVFILGGIGYLVLAPFLPAAPFTLLLGLVRQAYVKVGVTFPALAALSIYLLVVTWLLFQQRAGAYEFRRHPNEHLEFIADLSPMYGLLGTTVGLAAAIAGLDLSNGLQTGVVHFTSDAGEAIWSTFVGIILTATVVKVQFFFGLRSKGREDKKWAG